MASNQRDRSPSASRLNDTSSSSSATVQHLNSFDPASFSASSTFSAPTLYAGAYQDPTLFADPSYTFASQQGDKLQLVPDNLAFYQAQGFGSAQDNTTLSDLDYNVSPTALSQDSSAFPSFDFNQTDFSNNNVVDTAFLAELDSQQGLGASLDTMAAASMQAHSPTPPHLMPEMARRQSASPSPIASPVFQQPTYTGPRNVSESLDPSSAMYPHTQGDWSNIGSYRTHQRTPSDQFSDYSSHSNQASPYLQTYDNFDANAQASPLLNPQQDPVFNDGLGLQQFTLNENHTQVTYPTPGHSPQPSPRLPPQQQALPMYGDSTFGLSSDHFQQNNALDMFPGTGQEPFPQLNSKPQSPSDLGAADQMSPPDIHVDYAPPAANPNQIVRVNNDGEALSPPPARTQSRNRMRAKSDSYAGSRSPSPALPGRGRSPSLQPQMSNPDSLSPLDAASSRSPSPRGRVDKTSSNRARSASHTSDHRDYILNLAEPERTPSNGVKDNGRVQKHPATFQCHLCPKRFTRAYNLRSHLRTHTDERPFVCTVCGKAFARQHDRKRHEGLHSGEKKFVCKGSLQSGVQWGCGRRFARADALGRHFRSEAGRVCIKPLLEEEAEERHKNWLAEQQAQQQSHMTSTGLMQPAPLLSQPQQLDMNSNFLPAVLLQQYPALAGIDWNSLPQGPPPDEDMYSGRSSFEASSGGEYYEDLSENEMGNGAGFADAQMGGIMQSISAGMQAQGGAMQSQQQQQQQGYVTYTGQSRADFLSDFEGR